MGVKTKKLSYAIRHCVGVKTKKLSYAIRHCVGVNVTHNASRLNESRNEIFQILIRPGGQSG